MICMKVLMICGVFAEVNEEEIVSNSTAPVEFSANNFQKKLIRGFSKKCEDFYVVSAPFIGTFPTASKKMKFSGFQNEQSEYEYVHFNNIWGFRNISRAISLKHAVKSFAEEDSEDKLIIAYSAHTPFIEAAVYAKTIDPNIKLCAVIPDLPDYMRLNGKRNKLYDLAKKYDKKRMYGFLARFDSFVLLTEQMKTKLPVDEKPCVIVEGVVDDINCVSKENAIHGNEINIVYTGKMSEKFGIIDLIEQFMTLENKDLRLVLCGSGDCDEYVTQQCIKDERIIQVGQVTASQALEYQKNASVLINPRPNNEEYTKYSFPSKNIEYLLTGKPVAAYMLDGMPEVYREFIYIISGKEDIAKTIMDALDSSSCSKKYDGFIEYAKENLTAEKIAGKILEMTRSS